MRLRCQLLDPQESNWAAFQGVHKRSYVVLHRTIDRFARPDRSNECEIHRGRALCGDDLRENHASRLAVDQCVACIGVGRERNAHTRCIELQDFDLQVHMTTAFVIEDGGSDERFLSRLLPGRRHGRHCWGKVACPFIRCAGRYRYAPEVSVKGGRA